MTWEEGVSFEVEFWEKWLRAQGGEWADDYKRRLDPLLPVQSPYVEIIDQCPGNPVRVLDVGAGPLTIFGRVHPRKRIIIVPTDALARQYDILLDRYNITPPVRTVYAEAEHLTDHFSADSFDIVHAQNSIDHCRAPYDAIRQMLSVVKNGGLICLGHNQNEAGRENYLGFHQWNFTEDDGDFVFWSKHETINVSRELGSAALVDASCQNQWVAVNIRKLHASKGCGLPARSR